MSDENKQVTTDEKSDEQKAQMSDEALEKVSGGGTPQKSEGKPTESISIAYEQIQYQYYTQD